MAGSGALLPVEGGSNQDEETGQSVQEAPERDAATFTLLYDLFEQRVFNVCHRLLGSAEDAADATQEAFLEVLAGPQKREGHDSNFRVYLFAAAHGACHGVISERTRIEASDERAGGELVEVFVDPERASLLSSLQEDVRSANRALCLTEREALALRELEYFSYAEIADIMRVDPRDSVAELIASARVRLRDELRGSALAQTAAANPACRRALLLTAMAQDGQLREGEERQWLAGHLETCQSCRASREAMNEAGISYRAWLRIVPPHWLRDATVLRAVELAGAGAAAVTRGGSPAELGDRDESAAGGPQAADDGSQPQTTVAETGPATQPVRSDHYDRRRFTLGALSTLLLLLGVGAALVIASGGSRHTAATSGPRAVTEPTTNASTPTPIPRTEPSKPPRRKASQPLPARTPNTTATRSAPGSRLGAPLPKLARPKPKPVRRTPVRRGVEGGPFVTRPTSPSPPTQPTQSAPTTTPSPHP